MTLDKKLKDLIKQVDSYRFKPNTQYLYPLKDYVKSFERYITYFKIDNKDFNDYYKSHIDGLLSVALEFKHPESEDCKEISDIDRTNPVKVRETIDWHVKELKERVRVVYNLFEKSCSSFGVKSLSNEVPDALDS